MLISRKYIEVPPILEPLPHSFLHCPSGLFQSTCFACPASCRWKPEKWFFCMKHVIFSISQVRICVQIFLREIGNLYFMYENLLVQFSSSYMESCLFHIWISVHTFSYTNGEFYLFQIWKVEHRRSCLNWEIVYLAYMKISTKSYWHEVCN